MRDLNINELENVYGACGTGCNPPPSCDPKPKKTGSKCKQTKKKSNKRGSKGCW